MMAPQLSQIAGCHERIRVRTGRPVSSAARTPLAARSSGAAMPGAPGAPAASPGCCCCCCSSPAWPVSMSSEAPGLGSSSRTLRHPRERLRSSIAPITIAGQADCPYSCNIVFLYWPIPSALPINCKMRGQLGGEQGLPEARGRHAALREVAGHPLQQASSCTGIWRSRTSGNNHPRTSQLVCFKAAPAAQ